MFCVLVLKLLSRCKITLYVCVFCGQLQERHCGAESSLAFDELRSTIHRVGLNSPGIIESLVVGIIRSLGGCVLSDSDVDSAVSTALR